MIRVRWIMGIIIYINILIRQFKNKIDELEFYCILHEIVHFRIHIQNQ